MATTIEWTDVLCTTRALAQLVAAATAWVEDAADHPNEWAGEADNELIRAVRRLNPDVRLRWLDDPRYAGWWWVDHTNPAGGKGAEDPVASVTATEYRLSLLPEDHPDVEVFVLLVAWRGHGKWAVQHGPLCLGADGEWDHARAGAYIDNPTERDRWFAAHRFGLATALRLAEEHLPKIRVNGVTAVDLLAREAGR